MFRMLAVLAAAAAMSVASATVYMKETFDDDGWSDRWTVGGEGWGKTLGEWKHTSSLSNDADKGIQTGEDARHYSLTAPLDAPFDNTGKDLVVSYTVRHEQNLDCGGAYIKLLPEGVDAASFSGDSEYAIMFGPDVCGSATRKTHAIFTYKGKNLLSKKTIRTETDNLPHRFTLIVHPDNTFAVEIDGEVAEEGSLYDNWDFLAPKEIDDPEDSKPADWEDDAEIPDPEDEKPAGWDDVPEFIPDPDAEQPEDWDEEEDGEWEAPMISNPEYKGEWKPKMIPNPNYKGVWKPRQIANPEFEDDDSVYAVCGSKPCSAVGFELWQVKAGTVFDDIIVTDSVEEARAFAAETFDAKKDAEKEAYDAKKEEERKAAEEERKRAEEERKAAEDDEDDEDDEEL